MLRNTQRRIRDAGLFNSGRSEDVLVVTSAFAEVELVYELSTEVERALSAKPKTRLAGPEIGVLIPKQGVLGGFPGRLERFHSLRSL